MATASEIITDALGELFNSAGEQPVVAEEMSSGIRYLNRMMNAWSASGLALGFTVITSPSDTITVADGALDGIVSNLAVRLAPRYGMEITPELNLNARDGKKVIRKLAVSTRATSHPCTLPIGSGNESSFNGTTTEKFYPCPEDSALTEEGGNITLESDT